MRQLSICLLIFEALTACVSTTPNKEYAIAQTALATAKKFQADKLFPKTYSKALSLYQQGTALYNRQNYDKAATLFEESIQWAEKAEFKARFKQLKEDE